MEISLYLARTGWRWRCWVSDNWIFDKAPGVNIHIKARTWTQRRWCLKTASVGKCYKSKFHTLAREKVWILKQSLVELKRMIGWCWMMKIWFKLSEDHRSSWRGGMQSPLHSINRLTFTKLLYEVRSPGETNAVSQIHHTITQICSVCNNSNTITQSPAWRLECQADGHFCPTTDIWQLITAETSKLFCNFD